ncbi:MAG: type II toxin-antitoxin system PemK/MazF family toxin [Fimbriimonadales bacterium]|nr:type II toxin-antitoxin system PemK/MazF family toxin [Fimbriimonadales bacterium]
MKRGEVWLINLDPTIGAEIKKTRPAIIVSVDEIGILPLRVIVPLTEWKERYAEAPWMVRVIPDERNGLDKVSSADTFQVRSVSVARFVHRIGEVSSEVLREIEQSLAITLGIVSAEEPETE